ncbi:MAG: ferritin-like domain-containing protein [Clostridiales bacterium]|jgi:rubrerythrin|nr:ferritin-like domain-containing protein [Clostridiales bacterium]
MEKPIPPDQKILDILLEALKDATMSSAYLLHLHERADDPAEKEILRQIRMTGLKHIRLFQSIHQQLTGEEAVIPDSTAFLTRKVSEDLSEEYAKTILSKLESAEYCRKIYFGFASAEIRDILFEIITDEQNMAIQFNYLYSRFAR